MAESIFQRRLQQEEKTASVRQRKAVLQDNRGVVQTAKLTSRAIQLMSIDEKNSEVEALLLSAERNEEDGARDPGPIMQGVGNAINSNGVAQRTKVRNLVGTSHLKSKRAKSWKAHHTSAAGKKAWKKCLVKGCRRLATVGAHVEDTSVGTHTTNRYIAPFCQYHNKRPAGSVLTLKPGGALVGVGSKKRVRKTD